MTKPYAFSHGLIVSLEIDIEKADAINALLVRPGGILQARQAYPIPCYRWRIPMAGPAGYFSAELMRLASLRAGQSCLTKGLPWTSGALQPSA